MRDIVSEFLKTNGYTLQADKTMEHISEWEDWYQGYVKKFHHYNVYNGVKTVGKDRMSMQMAKRICEDWANLLLNEKVTITTESEFSVTLGQIFENNNFIVKGNQLIELMFAFGTAAFVEYLDQDEQVVIDYIRAEMIRPITYDNGIITECAFASPVVVSGDKAFYIQIHKMEDSQYIIENHYVCAESGKELELPDDIEEIVATGYDKPLFQIITPNIINNIDFDSPMGVSCFANGIDQLKAVDLVYDSYCNEFRLGKKRIIVPTTFAKIQMQEDRTVNPIFDPNDTEFYSYQAEDTDPKAIKEINMDLRAVEHEQALQRMLDLLSMKCGLGNDRYRFENGTAKTATEVISEKSELYQNLMKHEIVIKDALIRLVDAIAFLSGAGDQDVSIEFDDSIITDKETQRQQDRQDLAAGIMAPEEYRAKWYGESREEALKNLPQQAQIIE